MQQEMILVGVIHGAHGVAGQLRVESLSDNPLRFSPGSVVYASLPKQQPRPLTISSAKPHQGRLLVLFTEINSREAAQQLLGAQLLAEPGEASLPAGQYYHYQLMGLAVYQQGQLIGEITDILSRPANDVYVLQTPDKQEIWLPALKSVVKQVDIDNRRMEVEMQLTIDD